MLCFSQNTYLDMQDVDLLDFAQNDPKGFLYAYSRENAYGIIIDEAQYAPVLFKQNHTNLGKRLVKSPKIYFYDIGLALALLGISKDELLIQRSLYGAIFENMVIVDCLKNSNAVGAHAGLSFFRSSTGDEVDLVLELFGKTIPVEIKSSETLQSRFFKTINWFNDQVKSASQPVLIYGGDKDHIRSGVLIISWKSLPAQLIKK